MSAELSSESKISITNLDDCTQERIVPKIRIRLRPQPDEVELSAITASTPASQDTSSATLRKGAVIVSSPGDSAGSVSNIVKAVDNNRRSTKSYQDPQSSFSSPDAINKTTISNTIGSLDSTLLNSSDIRASVCNINLRSRRKKKILPSRHISELSSGRIDDFSDNIRSVRSRRKQLTSFTINDSKNSDLLSCKESTDTKSSFKSILLKSNKHPVCNSFQSSVNKSSKKSFTKSRNDNLANINLKDIVNYDNFLRLPVDVQWQLVNFLPSCDKPAPPSCRSSSNNEEHACLCEESREPQQPLPTEPPPCNSEHSQPSLHFSVFNNEFIIKALTGFPSKLAQCDSMNLFSASPPLSSAATAAPDTPVSSANSPERENLRSRRVAPVNSTITEPSLTSSSTLIGGGGGGVPMVSTPAELAECRAVDTDSNHGRKQLEYVEEDLSGIMLAEEHKSSTDSTHSTTDTIEMTHPSIELPVAVTTTVASQATTVESISALSHCQCCCFGFGCDDFSCNCTTCFGRHSKHGTIDVHVNEDSKGNKQEAVVDNALWLKTEAALAPSEELFQSDTGDSLKVEESHVKTEHTSTSMTGESTTNSCSNSARLQKQELLNDTISAVLAQATVTSVSVAVTATTGDHLQKKRRGRKRKSLNTEEVTYSVLTAAASNKVVPVKRSSRSTAGKRPSRLDSESPPNSPALSSSPHHHQQQQQHKPRKMARHKQQQLLKPHFIDTDSLSPSSSSLHKKKRLTKQQQQQQQKNSSSSRICSSSPDSLPSQTESELSSNGGGGSSGAAVLNVLSNVAKMSPPLPTQQSSGGNSSSSLFNNLYRQCSALMSSASVVSSASSTTTAKVATVAINGHHSHINAFQTLSPSWSSTSESMTPSGKSDSGGVLLLPTAQSGGKNFNVASATAADSQQCGDQLEQLKSTIEGMPPPRQTLTLAAMREKMRAKKQAREDNTNNTEKLVATGPRSITDGSSCSSPSTGTTSKPLLHAALSNTAVSSVSSAAATLSCIHPERFSGHLSLPTSNSATNNSKQGHHRADDDDDDDEFQMMERIINATDDLDELLKNAPDSLFELFMGTNGKNCEFDASLIGQYDNIDPNHLETKLEPSLDVFSEAMPPDLPVSSVCSSSSAATEKLLRVAASASVVQHHKPPDHGQKLGQSSGGGGSSDMSSIMETIERVTQASLRKQDQTPHIISDDKISLKLPGPVTSPHNKTSISPVCSSTGPTGVTPPNAYLVDSNGLSTALSIIQSLNPTAKVTTQHFYLVNSGPQLVLQPSSPLPVPTDVSSHKQLKPALLESPQTGPVASLQLQAVSTSPIQQQQQLGHLLSAPSSPAPTATAIRFPASSQIRFLSPSAPHPSFQPQQQPQHKQQLVFMCAAATVGQDHKYVLLAKPPEAVTSAIAGPSKPQPHIQLLSSPPPQSPTSHSPALWPSFGTSNSFLLMQQQQQQQPPVSSLYDNASGGVVLATAKSRLHTTLLQKTTMLRPSNPAVVSPTATATVTPVEDTSTATTSITCSSSSSLIIDSSAISDNHGLQRAPLKPQQPPPPSSCE